jgi:hypothetical protein
MHFFSALFKCAFAGKGEWIVAARRILAVTLWDHAMVKALAILLLLVTFSGTTLAQTPREMVGKYQMEVQDGDILELRPDGTATLADEVTRWAVKGNQLTVGTDVMPFVLQAGRLILMVGPVRVSWKRLSGGVGTASPMERAAQKTQPTEPTGGSNPQDAQVRQILMNNAWCSFTYNKVSGTSTTRRVVFRPDGVMSINGGAETYSSGYGGTYAGQSNNSSAVLWKLENLRVLVDDRSGAGYQDIGLTSTTNSNGSIILKTLGKEYAMCR